MNILQLLAQIQNNPAAILGQYGIPKDLMNDPQGAIQFLMNNGKISQRQYDSAVQTARNMGIKI